MVNKDTYLLAGTGDEDQGQHLTPTNKKLKIRSSDLKIGLHARNPMGEEHNVVFGQGPKVNKAKSTPTSPSICLMRHIEGEVSVLLALLTLGPCPKTTLCSSPIG